MVAPKIPSTHTNKNAISHQLCEIFKPKISRFTWDGSCYNSDFFSTNYFHFLQSYGYLNSVLLLFSCGVLLSHLIAGPEPIVVTVVQGGHIFVQHKWEKQDLHTNDMLCPHVGKIKVQF